MCSATIVTLSCAASGSRRLDSIPRPPIQAPARLGVHWRQRMLPTFRMDNATNTPTKPRRGIYLLPNLFTTIQLVRFHDGYNPLIQR